MNAYTLTQVKKLKKLQKKDTEYLLHHAVKIGSFFYNNITFENFADKDYIVYSKHINIEKIKDYEKYFYICQEENSQNTTSIYFFPENEIYAYNLIIIKEKKEYIKWKQVSNIMMQLSAIRSMNTKMQTKENRLKLSKFILDFI